MLERYCVEEESFLVQVPPPPLPYLSRAHLLCIRRHVHVFLSPPSPVKHAQSTHWPLPEVKLGFTARMSITLGSVEKLLVLFEMGQGRRASFRTLGQIRFSPPPPPREGNFGYQSV